MFVHKNGLSPNNMKHKAFALQRFAHLYSFLHLFFSPSSFVFSRYLSTIHNCQDILTEDYLQLISCLHQPHQFKRVCVFPNDYFSFSLTLSQLTSHFEIDDVVISKFSLIIPHFDESLLIPFNSSKALKGNMDVPSSQVTASPKRTCQGIFKENSKAFLGDPPSPKFSHQKTLSQRKEEM